MPASRHETSLANDNREITVIASGATGYAAASSYNGSRAAGVTTNDILNYGATGCFIVTDVTVISGTPTLQVELQGKDSASGKYFNIVSGTVISATRTQVIRVHPSFTSGATIANPGDIIAKDALCRLNRIRTVMVPATSSGAITYTLGFIPIIR